LVGYAVIIHLPIGKYFYNKPHFWTGAYFVASCGNVTINQLKTYVENQKAPQE
jgi:putative transposase